MSDAYTRLSCAILSGLRAASAAPCFGGLVLAGRDRQLDPGLPDDDGVTRLQLGLVDLLAVDERALGRTDVDDADVAESVDLDDRVHAAHRGVLELEVRRGDFAELDHGECQPLLV